MVRSAHQSPLAWKDKILDYEIETAGGVVGMRYVSIDWKDKILDYEIETAFDTVVKHFSEFLEKIRFSITRLKPAKTCCVGRTWFVEKIRFSITRLKHTDIDFRRGFTRPLKR